MENPFKKERKVCILCKLNIDPDYKNIRLLSQFQSRHTGGIYEKHITGLCDYKQNKVVQEIRKAQQAGNISFYFNITLHILYGNVYIIMFNDFLNLRFNGLYD